MVLRRPAIRSVGARIGFVAVVLAITGVTFGLRPAWAATIRVTGTGDTVSVDGAVTLREAVTSINNGANINADVVATGAYGTNDTILFNLTLPALIKLTSNNELAITKDMTITGPAAGVVAVDGNSATRVFHNTFGTTLTMEHLTIQNGVNAGDGGGIWNDGTVSLTKCILASNTASGGNGGGFFNEGSSTATLTKCTLSGNTASGNGGGFYNDNFATLIDCTLSGNTATNGDGGGLWSDEDVTVTGSTFIGNKATNGSGGGLFNTNPTATITNCTFSGNSATNGGGFANESTAIMANCTLSGNSATGVGGGIFNSDTLTLINTIAANSGSGNDCFNNGTINVGSPVTGDHNLIELDTLNNAGTNKCSDGTNGDITGTDPLLGPLANNGGPTQTFALCTAAGIPDASCTGRSQAIDAGDDAVTGTPLNLTTDQRGLPRLFGLHVDIGSFEVQPQALNHAAPALSTISLAILAALLGAFGWWRPRARRTPSITS